MSDAPRAPGELTSLAVARHVDDACVRFERAWKAGERPVIEEYLGDTGEPARSRLLGELVALEAAYRRGQGEKVQADEYQRRFPSLDPAALAGLCDTPVPEAPGTRLGPYKLLRQLGEGGMGVVFLAEQDEPVRRQVALKVIKAGLDSAHVLARFEQERQALALMDHPHIAKVLDAGSTPEGRPYFVMELVKGLPFTKYCDQEKLTPRERLELFIPVCQAVQHAHQKGVIHRDLKPSNVLIGLYDGKPVPKVIDFGVAKATAQRLTERTLFTEVGCLVGTLEYMAPEQAEVNNLDVDTRADIYSLGVILYELLTGGPPFTGRQLRSVAYQEMLRMIREVEPPKPSTKLSSSTELASIAAQRKLEPKKLTKMVHGDLDWIVMKCLAKERSRRYETANGLAFDIQRYLHDEPVVAGPPGAGYRIRKLARKHRVALGTAAAFAALVIGGTGVSIWQAVRATQAEQQAIEDRDKARNAEAQANEQRNKAIAEKDRADKAWASTGAVNHFLVSLLATASPENEPDRDVRLRTVLDRAAQSVAGKFDKQPLIEASIRLTIAHAYRGLGLYPDAELHLDQAYQLHRRVLGAEDRGTLGIMDELAAVYTHREKYDEAASLIDQVLETSRRVLGPESPQTLLAMHDLANVYRIQGKLDQAESLCVKAVEVRRKVCGPRDHDTLMSVNNLAILYAARHKYDKAEKLFEELVEVWQQKLGADHPLTLTAKQNLAVVCQEQGKLARAESIFIQVWEGRKRWLGPEHPDVAVTLADLGLNYLQQKEYTKAEARLRECLQICERNLPRSWRNFHAQSLLGGSLLGQQKYEEAEPLLRRGYEGLKARERTIQADERTCLTEALERLVQLYDAWGKPEQAKQWRAKQVPPEPPKQASEHP
jgi:serine/threonine protein kinase/tetratricopeptide (TPR) repeat protein